MCYQILRNKKAQQTAEYALLISLVVAAVIAMQTYAQRTMQARIRDASAQLTERTNALGPTQQYEPYYLVTSYETLRDETTEQRQSNGLFNTMEESRRTRKKGGYEEKHGCIESEQPVGWTGHCFNGL